MRARAAHDGHVLNLRVGEIVEVRSASEIASTLDERGELDALPFMPEMLQFCGKRFRVHRLAIKLCDTINMVGMRRMEDAVHLEGIRCDGQAHGGCQAACLIYWKEAWLKKVDAEDLEDRGEQGALCDEVPASLLEKIMRATRKGGPAVPQEEVPQEDEIFSCQATELVRAAPEPIRWWEPWPYVMDVRSGNARPSAMLRTLCVGLFNRVQTLSKKIVPRPLLIQSGRRFPFIEGSLKKTPQQLLDLQPGELVRIKSKEEIVQTLDVHNRNRGLSFDPEMLKYCGQQARVLGRVSRLIEESTGKMLHLKNPCIILDDVVCCGDYHQQCPRGTYPYWREIWLERVQA
jgi:hypothetical protein